MEKSIVTAADVKTFISKLQGKEIALDRLRRELQIAPGTKSYDRIRSILFELQEQKLVKQSGKRDGIWKVLYQVSAVPIYSQFRERKAPFELFFPRDADTGVELPFGPELIIREGDLILIGGVSNKGKTCLCLNFCAENIDKYPVLMGHEYTSPDGLPAPRFLSRLDDMDWVQWVDQDGNDKITLLPVTEDYAEYIVPDRINVVDWIDMKDGQHFLVGQELKALKKAVGKGVIIVALQKSEGIGAARGGQFTRDYTDVELLVDGMGVDEVVLTLGKVKEGKGSGHSYAYHIAGQGTKLVNVREVRKCPKCWGRGKMFGGDCQSCNAKGYMDV